VSSNCCRETSWARRLSNFGSSETFTAFMGLIRKDVRSHRSNGRPRVELFFLLRLASLGRASCLDPLFWIYNHRAGVVHCRLKCFKVGTFHTAGVVTHERRIGSWTQFYYLWIYNYRASVVEG
jgi:hypothetical protein